MERYQDSPITFYNRYPVLWKRAASGILIEAPRILIVGCSTGEECITALAYIPGASIVAVEADEVTLRFAMLRHQHPSIRYASASDGLPAGEFDLVCCNSVLCKHPENLAKEQVPPESFQRFSAMVTEIASRVAMNGLLMMHNAEHRFSDATASARFKAITTELAQSVAVFDKDGKRTNDKAPSIWRRTT